MRLCDFFAQSRKKALDFTPGAFSVLYPPQRGIPSAAEIPAAAAGQPHGGKAVFGAAGYRFFR